MEVAGVGPTHWQPRGLPCFILALQGGDGGGRGGDVERALPLQADVETAAALIQRGDGLDAELEGALGSVPREAIHEFEERDVEVVLQERGAGRGGAGGRVAAIDDDGFNAGGG